MSTKFFAAYLAIAIIGALLVIFLAPAQASTHEAKPRVDWSSAEPACKPKSKRIWCK